MKIYKNKKIKISALIIFLLFSLFLPTGEILAQELYTPPTPPPQKDFYCNNLEPGKTCTHDIDGDGIDDLEFTNKGTTEINGTDITKLESKSLKVKSIGGSQFNENSDLAKYIAAVYKNSVILITILTTIMIIIAGVMWTTSGGNAERVGKAQQMIARAFTGLVIALGSYTLLYTINPDLVSFRNLQIIQVDKANNDIPDDTNLPDGGTPAELTDLVNLTGMPGVAFGAGVDKRATSAAKASLGLAIEQFKGYNTGKSAVIASAVRTAAQQYNFLSKNCGCLPTTELLLPKLKENKITKVTGDDWKKYCDKTLGTSACPASYKSLTLEVASDKYTFKTPLVTHFGGYAFDMGASDVGSNKPCGGYTDPNITSSKGVPNAGKISGDVCIPKEQQKLIRAMLDNNFCVGLKGSDLREPWHFELMGVGVNSQFCTKDLTDPNLLKLYYTQNPTVN